MTEGPVPVDFHEDRRAVHRLALADGSLLEVHYEVASLLQVGWDPAGYPMYQLTAQPFVRVVSPAGKKSHGKDQSRMVR
ncbi:MAG: hypothetical protein KGI89_02935 [Euryarchaeota archaeon]|nr:hypothetical protein [Euryarchaeota archaeon]